MRLAVDFNNHVDRLTREGYIPESNLTERSCAAAPDRYAKQANLTLWGRYSPF
ncbi:hypothetical protein R75483_02184 [Paraburkholderia domus]|nr:hypothetical protein R75483_02184 [Paraburkholderia domus]